MLALRRPAPLQPAGDSFIVLGAVRLLQCAPETHKLCAQDRDADLSKASSLLFSQSPHNRPNKKRGSGGLGNGD